ncbi:hypothetical protein [Sporosarcina sp. A2]|uniref:hypothetical protein n=1 Tax=Sporosarcina sp. A2 TaxID=3393449 RepID=UPI003D79A42D
MKLFILGILFVFAKFNLQFIDTGVLYYATNIIGYGLIYTGLRSMSNEMNGIQRVLPFALFMILHSLGFAVLNGTGHSIKTIPLSTGTSTILALSLVALAVAGMIMIVHIIQQFILVIRTTNEDSLSYSNITSLEKFPAMVIVLMIITGILFFTFPAVAPIAMILLIVTEGLFVLKISSHAQYAL